MPIKSFYAKVEHPNTVIESMIIGKDDKRDFIRMTIESEVTFTRPDSTEIYEGKTIDLSATGIRFITSTEVKVGEMLDITVKPGVSITPPLDITMAVVRVTKTDDGRYDVAGVSKTNNR